jgi:uncharacterized membrane-anchored protein YhcB (DUF1043 family)
VLTKLILVLGLICSLPAFATENTTSINNETPGRIVEINLKENAELYKILYENSKSANDRLITTIHLIIGVVITFLIALFGTQFLFNFKLKKEEIHSIKTELDKKISNSNFDFIKQINTLYNDKEKLFRQDFNLFKQEISKNIDVRLFDEHKSINLNFDKCKQDTETVKSALEYKIEHVDIKLEKNIGDVWDLKGVKANALARYTTTAILELKNGHEIKYTLSDIVTIINKEIEITEGRKNELDNLISLLPAKYESQRDAIEFKLNSMRVFKYVDDPINVGQRIEMTVREATA